MEEMTVSQVSRDLGISTRMLRYYEKAGLISSSRKNSVFDTSTPLAPHS